MVKICISIYWRSKMVKGNLKITIVGQIHQNIIAIVFIY